MTAADSQDPWFVVRTQRARERYAAENIARTGTAFYLPEVMETVRILVAGKRRREFRRRPLFPGYLFTRPSNGQWHFLLRTFGVIGLVTGAMGEPGTLRDSVIKQLRVREDADGVIRLPTLKFELGQKVRIGQGHGGFSGYVGLVDGYTAAECVRVLLDCMGRKVPFLIEEPALEAA